ncbi:MAG: hypothetical protein V3U27_17560, partial [Candidatus Tectomicrobia bacterium]
PSGWRTLPPGSPVFCVSLERLGANEQPQRGKPSRHAHTAGRRTQKQRSGREHPAGSCGGGPWERHATRRLVAR